MNAGNPPSKGIICMFTSRTNSGTAARAYIHPLMPIENDTSDVRKNATPTAAKKNCTRSSRHPTIGICATGPSRSRAGVRSTSRGIVIDSGFHTAYPLTSRTTAELPRPSQNALPRKTGLYSPLPSCRISSSVNLAMG